MIEVVEARICDNYEEGECPDCGDPIPEDAENGYECKNCGHIFSYKGD